MYDLSNRGHKLRVNSLTDDECDMIPLTYPCCIAETEALADTQIPVAAVMLVLTLILLPIFMFMTVKVTRMVWPKEKLVVAMLVMLCVTLLSMLGYYSFVMKDMRNPSWFCSYPDSYRCSSSFFN